MRRLILAGLLVLGLGGCGSTQRPLLSSAALRVQAAAICAAASARANAIPAPGFPNTATFLARGRAVLGAEFARLRTLHPGGRAEATYRRALASFGAELTAIDRARARLRAGGDAVVTVRALQRELAPPEAAARRAWQGLGIPSCLA